MKIPCKLTLEEEYAFEHKQRIKAEKYIEELWNYNSELIKEVKKLQEIVNKGEHSPEKKPPLSDKIKLEMRLEKIFKNREKSVNNMDKIIKRTFK